MQHDSSSRLLAFYRGAQPDDRSRMLDAILAEDDGWLEWHHDFIQWLFPLAEPSGANPGAPTLSAADIAAFGAEPELRARLRAAWERMLRFYGFELDATGDSLAVRRSAAWPARSQNWLYPGSHNFLRISRIIQSLRLLGLPDEARAFFAALEELYHGEGGHAIGATTWGYWQRAARDALTP